MWLERGVGSAGALGVAPLAVDFGGVSTGKSSSAKLVTVSNSGRAALTLLGVEFGGAGDEAAAADREGITGLVFFHASS